MRMFLLTLLLVTTVVLAAATGQVQKKPSKCEQGTFMPRNWEMIEKDYIFFDYILCPADMKPSSPLVRVWITTRGYGFAVEKWAPDRDGADAVSVFYENKRAFTLYRDLKAIPLQLFKAERRTGVAEEIARQPFFMEGTTLVPSENLTPESAERAKKVFENADIVIKKAQAKLPLLYDASRLKAIADNLDRPLKAQQ